MSDEIIKVLDNLGQKFGIAIDWTSQNVLPYLQDLMNRFIGYKNVVAIVWIIISITMLGLSVFGLIKLFKWKKSDKYDCYDDSFCFGAILVAIIVLMIILIITLACNTQGLIQNIFIPELSILDYITYYGGM